MTSLIKGILTAAGAAVTTVTAIVISKNEKDRKEWLDEMGNKVDKAFDSLSNTIDKTVDQIKSALD